MIAFKSKAIESQFDDIKPRLRALLTCAGGYMFFKYGVTIVITSLIREGRGTHVWGNGADIRTSNLTEKEGDDLVEFIKWQLPYFLKTPMPDTPKYSVRDERKAHTSDNWSGSHIHVQTNYREA